MLAIEEPPDIKACAACSSPLCWLYSARTKVWVAFCTDPMDVRTLHVHDHPLYGSEGRSWRHLPTTTPEKTRVGVARARQALTTKGDSQ